MILAASASLASGATSAQAQARDEARRPGTLRLGLRSQLIDYQIDEVSAERGDPLTTRTVTFAPLSEGLGFQLHYVVSPYLGVGLGPSIAVARASDDLGDVTALGLSLPLELEVMAPRGKRRPYVLASVGLRVERVRFDFDEEEATGLGPQIRLAAGIHGLMSDRFVEIEGFRGFDVEQFVDQLKFSRAVH